MIGNFCLVPDDQLGGLLADPTTIHGFLDKVYEQETGDLVDIDKAWHCLHFLLTGTAWEGDPPLNFIVAGGKEVGEEDVGYGPARAFTSVEVRRIADALGRIDRSQLIAGFSGKSMNDLEIYPAMGWQDIDPSSEESFGYFTGAFDTLKDLLGRGRDRGLGLLVWLS